MHIYQAKYSQLKEFYVYQYLRSRKSKYGNIGSPYNIGKGKGKRAFSIQHTIKPPKDRSKIQFISENMNEADAFQLEMLLIHLFGRIDVGTGCLRNMTDGGEGTTGKICSIESSKRYSKRSSGRIWINNGVKHTLIHPEFLPEYESNGYKKGMLSSSVVGLVWVHNPSTLKSSMVKTSDVQSYLSNGYVNGRPALSDKTKKKLSRAFKNRTVSTATRKLMSNARIAFWRRKH